MLLCDTIGELVELVDKVANVDAAHGICLRKGHCLREPLPAVQPGVQNTHSHRQRLRLARRKPTHSSNLVKFVLIVDHHRLVVVLRHDLISILVKHRVPAAAHLVKVHTELAQEQF